jgi:hypothetical protein
MDEPAETDRLSRRSLDDREHAVAARVVVLRRDLDPSLARRAIERLAVAHVCHRFGIAVDGLHRVEVFGIDAADDEPRRFRRQVGRSLARQ